MPARGDVTPDLQWRFDGQRWVPNQRGSSPGELAPGGEFYWDGNSWLSTISPGGQHRWDGQSWQPTGPGPGPLSSHPPSGFSPAPKKPSLWPKVVLYVVAIGILIGILGVIGWLIALVGIGLAVAAYFRPGVRSWSGWRLLPGLAGARSGATFAILLALYLVVVPATVWGIVFSGNKSSSSATTASPAATHQALAPTSPTPSTTASTISSPSAATTTSTPPPATTAPTPPPNDPHQLTAANVAKSIRDNASYTVAVLDDLDVHINAGGEIEVWTKPPGLYSETQLFKITARNAYTVSRATQMGWYQGVDHVKVHTKVDVTDALGNKSVDDSMYIIIYSTLAQRYGWDGLAGRVVSQPSNMYCASSAYNVPTYIWKNVSTGDRGCMNDIGQSFGS